MTVTVRQCDPESLPHMLALVDQQFVYGRGRQTSLGARFPNVFTPRNLDNLHVGWSDQALQVAAVVRKFAWRAERRTWQGAMLGLVCTAPAARGKGFGSQLLTAVLQRLRDSGIDFVVLWTTIPGFYERLGWVVCDRGLWGVAAETLSAETLSPDCLAEDDGATCDDDVAISPIRDPAWLERLRRRWCPQRVLRTDADYEATPVSVRRVECLASSSPVGQEAYALVGKRGTTGYLYELVGDSRAFARIWAAARRRYRELYVNDHPDNPSAQWLTDRQLVSWEPQPQTMWLKVSAEMNDASLDRWYIPYFDRI